MPPRRKIARAQPASCPCLQKLDRSLVDISGSPHMVPDDFPAREDLMTRKLMLTVDVEAQRLRAPSNHVEHLIWGRVGKAEAGLGEMMHLAEQHGVKLTAFLDWCEHEVYGDAILNVGREIAQRGHDLQLHAHPEVLDQNFWELRGLPRPARLGDMNNDQADCLVSHLVDLQRGATGVIPTAFRGGGYRFGKPLLEALATNGVRLDASVNPTRESQPVRLPITKQFVWSNGLIETPITVVERYRNVPRALELNFNIANFGAPNDLLDYLDVFWSERGSDAIASLVMHSWSFLRLNKETGYFEYQGPELLDRFQQFLESKPADIEIVTASDVIRLADADSLSFDESLSLYVLVAGTEAVEPAEPEEPAPKCPICGSNALELHGGIENRKCAKCGSLERQRVFHQVYCQFLRNEFDLIGKKTLAVAVAASEKRMYAYFGMDVTSCDIRPEVKPDLLCNISDMPEIADESFDCVIASFVFALVNDVDGALREIHRILKPGGRLLSWDALRMGKPTAEWSGDRLTKHYGADNFDKYKVGHFRTFGDLDLIERFQRHFLVKTFYGTDPATRQTSVWMCGVKRGLVGDKELAVGASSDRRSRSLVEAK
jgi:hypothetical protein